MTTNMLGQSCAILTALSWAFAIILFKRSGEHIPPMLLNLFKNAIGLVLLVVTLIVMGEGVHTLSAFPREDIGILLISGIIGIALADTLFFHSLNLIGVGIVAIVDCLYSPFVIFFSMVMLSETMTPLGYLGAGLVLGSVLIATGLAPPRNRTRAQLMLGIVLGAVSMALMAYGIALAKLVLDSDDFPLIWATTLRMISGTFILVVLAAASPKRKQLFSVFRPAPIWKHAVPASILGAYLSMILWIAGFKYADASIAAILNQTSTLFAIILATVLLKESFTKRKLAAVLLALTGVLLVTLQTSERPPMTPATPRPQTHGSQSAAVTAED